MEWSGVERGKENLKLGHFDIGDSFRKKLNKHISLTTIRGVLYKFVLFGA